MGRCPWTPPKGEALWNLSIGFVLRGGPTATYQRPCRPSPENKPINGFQGPLPLAEFQEAEPLGGVSGRSPAPSTGPRACPGAGWRRSYCILQPAIDLSVMSLTSSDLFGSEAPATAGPRGDRPLADRLRPRAPGEVVGQDHLLGPDGVVTRMLARGSLASLILWGPPGVGKTTIARLLAARAGLHFVQISAVFSGVADLKRVFEEAARRRRLGEGTLLFVDEIHRFNRAQQDGFLPVVEEGTITLIGATTENPSFALNGALLSRCQVLVLRRLDDPALDLLLSRAETELHRTMPLTQEARTALRAMADGDGRYLLNMAEQIAALPEATPPMDPGALSSLLARRAALYDKDREEHYNLISALHKSLRGSDPDAALYWF